MLALGIIAIVVNAFFIFLWWWGCEFKEPYLCISLSLCNILSIIYIALSL